MKFSILIFSTNKREFFSETKWNTKLLLLVLISFVIPVQLTICPTSVARTCILKDKGPCHSCGASWRYNLSGASFRVNWGYATSVRKHCVWTKNIVCPSHLFCHSFSVSFTHVSEAQQEYHYLGIQYLNLALQTILRNVPFSHFSDVCWESTSHRSPFVALLPPLSSNNECKLRPGRATARAPKRVMAAPRRFFFSANEDCISANHMARILIWRRISRKHLQYVCTVHVHTMYLKYAPYDWLKYRGMAILVCSILLK